MNPIDLLTIRLEQLEMDWMVAPNIFAQDFILEEIHEYKKAIAELKAINLKGSYEQSK